MPTQAPKIDPRTYDGLVARLEELVKQYTSEVVPDIGALLGRILAEDVLDPTGGLLAASGTRIDPALAVKLAALPGLGTIPIKGWQSAGEGEDLDPGGALIRLAARLAEIAIARLNRVPEKSFLAFLDLIGARLGPPRPARVPLTFHLAAGSLVDALVPAGTQAAAPPLEGEKAPVLFETERDLLVTRTRLATVFVHEPGADRWSDRTDFATGTVSGAFDPFHGEEPIEHSLYLRHAWLGEPPTKEVILRIGLADAAVPWPTEVVWERSGGWLALTTPRIVSPRFSKVLKIMLPDVPPAEPSDVAGQSGPWLRGRLNRPLRKGEPLPWIDNLRLGIHIAQPVELAPDLAFVNQTPVDPTQDFLPFGAKPKVGDAVYLASDEAFARQGAEVTLHLVPTNAGAANPSDDTLLEWQSWNGRDWHTFGRSGPNQPKAEVRDGTYGFRDEGDVTFLCPDVRPVAVGGEIRRWIRIRLAAGHYGFDLFFEEIKPGESQPSDNSSRLAVPAGQSFQPPQFRFQPPSFKPPSLRSIRLGYDYRSPFEEPSGILTVNDFEVRPQSPGFVLPDTGEPVAPGTIPAQPSPVPPPVDDSILRPQPAPIPLCFASFVPPTESLPALYLGFERPGDVAGFANRTVALYFGLDEALYGSDAKPKAVSQPPVLAWQHWNGVAWQPLGVRDETRGFTRRGLVTFVGPPVFPASQRFGRTAFWLRVRWERGDWPVHPQLRRVLTNTVWAVNAQTVAGEVLGSSRGERAQTFRTHRAPVLPGQRLEVREPEIPTAAERRTLENEEKEDAVRVVLDAAGHPAEVWVRWHEVPDFYASGPRSRHYVLDRASGEVRFGDGRRGLVPPPGTGNVRMTRYQVGGGPSGNRPAGSVTQIKGTIPYVDSVTHDEPAAGGAPEESLEMVRVLGPRRLRHRDRATALSDFEDLAYEASSEVARAKGIGAEGLLGAGTVRLIVVPREAGAKPVPSLALLELVRAYVEARLSPVVDLQVAGPAWLEVTVEAEIVPRVLEEATDVQNAVRARIASFLHPLTGGSDGAGWDFGRTPYPSDLYAWIEATPGVDHVRRLEIKPPEETGVRPEWFLIFSGEHRITLAGSTDEVTLESGSVS